MKHLSTLAVLLGFAVAGPAHAGAPHDTCVNPAVGVFTRPGPPVWASWTNQPGPVTTELDDPRWNQATARSFDTGTASPPVHVRALWSPDSAGQEYLYLSLVSDLDPNLSTPRDVFLGFRRPPGDTADSGSVGYIFQFHLAPNEDAALHALPDKVAAAPYYCGEYDQGECKDLDPRSLALGGDWWRLFRDPNNPLDPLLKCTTSSGPQINGHQYIQMNGGSSLTAPFTWVNDESFVHYWKLGTNRWAIQLRIKVTSTAGASISQGIEKGSTFWYEVTESVTQQYMSIIKYPAEPAGAARTGVHTSICVSPATLNDALYHQELGDADPHCPGASCVCPDCDPNKFSKLTDLGANPGDCDDGIRLAAIGARFNDPGPYDALTPFNTIKAIDASNVRRANTMIAQIQNTNSAAEGSISGTIQARFRIANWGSEPLGGDSGEFSDIRGGSAVCLGGACTAQTIAAGQQRAIHFDWKLGDDPVNGLSELCAYGLTPPAPGTCSPDDGVHGCPVGQTRSQVNPDPTTGGAAPCVKLHNAHECMFVELTAPSGNVNFVRASLFNNMDFAEMSTVSREALIDARNLPKAPGQLNQEIYVFVVPRNMPATVPSGTTTTGLIQNAAVTQALALSRPYLADIARLQHDDPARLQQIIDTLARQRPGQNPPVIFAKDARAKAGDERIPQIVSAMRVMPNDDWARAGNMVALVGFSSQSDHPDAELVHSAVDTLGPTVAAQIVPTLEIYPFYKPVHDVAYQPMASFALFLSHESTLGGVRYELDGATRVADNVYHLSIPVGNARKIQIRAQALAGTELPLPPGNPAWPCAGGCAACGGATRNCGLVSLVGSGVPGIIAGVLVIRPRRKKKRPAGMA